MHYHLEPAANYVNIILISNLRNYGIDALAIFLWTRSNYESWQACTRIAWLYSHTNTYLRAMLRRKAASVIISKECHRVLKAIGARLCGPMEVKSLDHSLYFVTFIDVYSGYTCLYFLQQKSDTFDKFQQWLVYAERHTQAKLKSLQSDNGGEYTSIAFLEFC